MKELFLLRGLPGAGKSTLAKTIGGKHFEADMYFIKDGEYKFEADKLKMAHNWCAIQTQIAMVDDEPSYCFKYIHSRMGDENIL